MRNIQSFVGIALSCMLIAGCDQKTEPTEAEAKADATAAAAQPEEKPSDKAEEAEKPEAEEADKAGDNFEGKIAMQTEGARNANIQYAVKGDKIKIDVSGTPGGDVDALLNTTERTLTLYREKDKKYVELKLDDIAKKAKDRAAKMELEKTGEKETIAGVECEKWELKDDTGIVSACVVKGPSFIDVSTFEQLTNIEVPPWAERLLESGYFPLQVAVKNKEGKVLISSKVTDWSRNTVDEAEMKVPEGYERVDAKALADQAKAATKKAAE